MFRLNISCVVMVVVVMGVGAKVLHEENSKIGKGEAKILPRREEVTILLEKGEAKILPRKEEVNIIPGEGKAKILPGEEAKFQPEESKMAPKNPINLSGKGAQNLAEEFKTLRGEESKIIQGEAKTLMAPRNPINLSGRGAQNLAKEFKTLRGEESKILQGDAKTLPRKEVKNLAGKTKTIQRGKSKRGQEKERYLLWKNNLSPGRNISGGTEEYEEARSESYYCGTSSVTLAEGESVPLTSPYYPYTYPSPIHCRWVAQAPINTVIHFYCPYFNVFLSPLCGKDSLTVSEGGLDDLSDGIPFCGHGYIDITLNSNRFVAHFITRVKGYSYSNNGFTCTLTAVARSSQCGLKNPSRIVNGEESAPNEWPWQAALRHKVTHTLFCGGSLISESWVVTAAHCAVQYQQDDIYVTLGDHWRDVFKPTIYSVVAQISQVIVHENFDRQTVDNDIALLKLSQAVTYSAGVRPICFPCSVTPQKLVGKTGIVTGWGATSYGGSASNVLNEVELPIISAADCKSYLGGNITQNMMCTYKHNYDACQGDSGGPLVWKGDNEGNYHLVGIVSWGFGCAAKDTPGVYATVTNYLAWIQINTGITVCP